MVLDFGLRRASAAIACERLLRASPEKRRLRAAVPKKAYPIHETIHGLTTLAAKPLQGIGGGSVGRLDFQGAARGSLFAS